MRTFFFFLTFQFLVFSLSYSQTGVNDWSAEVYYVKSKNLNVRLKPNSRARKVGAFKRYQKIVALLTGEDYGDWVKVVYPVSGFVYGKYLIPAEEFTVSQRRIPKKIRKLNDYFIEEIEYPETEFSVDEESGININLDDVEKFLLLRKKNITKIIYPFSGKLNPDETDRNKFQYETTQTATGNNWTFEERHVRAYYLNLRKKPSEHADIITTLEKNKKIVLVNIAEEKITPGWGHVIYPLKGFVYKKYLYRKALSDSSSLENSWYAKLEQNGDFPFVVFADSDLTVPADTIEPGRTYLKIVKNKNEKVARIIFPYDGYANPEEEVIADFEKEPNFGWSYEERFVKADFLNVRTRPSHKADILSVIKKYQKVLVLNTDEKITKGWKRIIYPVNGYIYSPYLFGKKEETEISDKINLPENSWKAEILGCVSDSALVLQKPDENAAVTGIIRKKEQAVFVNDPEQTEGWLVEVFPKQGFVKPENFLARNFEQNSYVGIGLLAGFYQLPIEKNLSNLKIPLGAVIDYAVPSARLLFRLGFFQTQTHLNYYELTTKQIYLTLRYSFLRLFSDKLEFYAGAGANYWFSKFQFTKYPDMEEYFGEENDSGFGYSLSAGMMYSFYDFFIDLQYYFWSSREAVFGPDPQPGEPSRQYKLYPGSNQFQVIVGYKFRL